MEMIRRDEYAVYKGTEYSISKIGNRFILRTYKTVLHPTNEIPIYL